ncbi:integration host factor subunit beta [Methylobacterium nigriterrae]|uniref:integration host factor subunit beta n=1 Tax=Methylobacterium nigriterrae TaxID=3127512 RepID=UPI0030140C01
MIKSDLTRRLAEQNPQLYEKDCEAIVNAILGRIMDALEAGDRVEIRGFAAFTIKTMRSKQGRNPRTGEKVDVAEKKAVHFKPGKEMRQRLNPGGENLEPTAHQLPRAS